MNVTSSLSMTRKAALIFLAAMLLLGSLGLQGNQVQAALPQHAANLTDNPEDGTVVFMPTLFRRYPWHTPFGVELAASITSTSSILYTRTTDLPTAWVRLNARISWRELQPNENDPINWALLADFEAELRTLRSARITPVVVVDDYPHWATDNSVRNDGQPTSCGPLAYDHVDDFALFMQALVARYKTSEFGVHIWELGNEPDVDPNLVDPNNVFGCWGNVNDPNYGGGRYGEMLKVVTPAIKAVDPAAQVWIGGLLLDNPYTTEPGKGRPELFLRGILASGAAPYFDAVPYHAYTAYIGTRVDHDLSETWVDWGGTLVGKANFLRNIMAEYGMDKPLYINEVGMYCNWCSLPLQDRLLQMQADFLVRSFSRALSANISGLMWYPMDGPGWYYSGLLDGSQNPKPVYTAYQHVITRTGAGEALGVVQYGAGIEAYAFGSSGKVTHVIFTVEDATLSISIPQSEFIAAYTRDGAPITPTVSGSNYTFQVTFEPIYLVRTR